MRNGLDRIRNRRRDLTPYLFHFIKGKGDKSPEVILSKILTERCLKSSKGVICFTEAPLTSCREMFDYMERFDEPMYTKYGIGIPRDLLFKHGARNVIYVKNNEVRQIPENMRWRCLPFEPESYDYTWLREWRLPVTEFDFSNFKDDLCVITPTDNDLIELTISYDVDAEYEYEAGDDPTINASSTGFRLWKGISIEEMVKINIKDDIELFYTISEQKLDMETDDVREKLYQNFGF